MRPKGCVCQRVPRENAFPATQGHFLEASVEEAIGTFQWRHGPPPVFSALLPAASVEPDDDRQRPAGFLGHIEVELLPLVATRDVFQVPQPADDRPAGPTCPGVWATPGQMPGWSRPEGRSELRNTRTSPAWFSLWISGARRGSGKTPEKSLVQEYAPCCLPSSEVGGWAEWAIKPLLNCWTEPEKRPGKR